MIVAYQDCDGLWHWRNEIDIETALAHAKQAEDEGLRGMYSMAARVLAKEVERLSRIESAAQDCDGIDLGRMTEVPTEAWDDLRRALEGGA